MNYAKWGYSHASNNILYNKSNGENPRKFTPHAHLLA